MKRKRSPKHGRGVARGRMFLASRLGWLSGVPLRITAEGIHWLAVPRFGDHTPREMVITGDHLARASRTWNKLVYRFPYALPRLVNDVEWWKTAVPELLSQLGQTLHHRVPLPAAHWSDPAVAEQALGLVRANPALQTAVNGLSWALVLYPDEQTAALQWIQNNQAAIQIILNQSPDKGLGLVLSLWFLTKRDGEPQTHALLTFLGNELLYNKPLSSSLPIPAVEKRLNSYLKKGQISHGLFEVPTPTATQTFRRFINWLMGQNKATSHRALVLWADLLPSDYLDTWEAWWASMELLLGRIRRITSRYPTAETKTEAEMLKKQLNELQETLPAALSAKAIFAAIQQAAVEPKLFDKIRLTLTQIPLQIDNHTPRPALLHHWVNLYDRYGVLAISFLNHFQTYLQFPPDTALLLRPWEDVWTRSELPRYYWGMDHALLQRMPEQKLWPIIFESVAQVTAASEEPLTKTDVENIASFVRLTRRLDWAVTYFEEFRAADLDGRYIDDDAMRCAHKLNDLANSQFGQLLKIMNSADDWLVSGRVMEAAAALEAAGWSGIGQALILSGELDAFQRTGQLYKTLQELGQEMLPPSPFPAGGDPVWLARYPETFHPVLRLLHTVSPTAEAAAQRILGKNYPDPKQLHEEIDTLRTRLAAQPDHPHLAKRLANLARRLSQPATVSAARIGRLEEKLRLAVQRAALKQWHGQLSAALRQHLAALFDMESLPDWLSEPAQLTILAPMLQLPTPFKLLGLRLFKTRVEAAPWSLIDDPANQAFVHKLEKSGIHMMPWLNPPSPQEMVGENGRTVKVTFETDPLEIFHMGGHFNTCLSPGAFNFFSVFANAADINKHVVYARGLNGQVVGRCLLALTDQGGLLTFEPYCHDSQLGFDKMMGDVANRLAEQMNTVPVINGAVSPLVATDWYDDGPRDLCGRFAFLAHDSSFRKSLPSLTAEQFMAQLQQGFDPLPLNALTLTLVLSMGELNQAPQLILPLLPYIEMYKKIADDLLLFAAELAYKAGEIGAAHRLVKNRAVPYLHQQYRNYRWVDERVARLLAELDPSATLRLLRQTRPYRVRRDEDEWGERREILALAHENLGRSVRAQRLRAANKSRG